MTVHLYTDEEIDALFTPPQRPPTASKPQPLPYEPTCTITCAACGARATIAIRWPGRLCADCRADLPAARQRAQQRLDDAAAVFERELEAWAAYQDALPAAVQAKWFGVKEQQTKLEMALNKALRGPYSARMAAEARQRIIAASRAKLDEFTAKVERTRRAPHHPLAAVLQREAQYQAALERANAETLAATIALQEIDAAQEGAPL